MRRAPTRFLTLALVAVSIGCGDDTSSDPIDAGRTTDTGTAPPDAPALDSPSPTEDAARPDAAPSGIPYDTNGPIPFTMRVETVDSGSETFDVTVYLPSTPGPHPVVSFSCGSTQTAAGYLPYGERLASYGIAMFITDDPGIFTNTADIVPNAVYVVDTWLPANFDGVIDPTRIGLAGHSRGGAVSLLAAEHGLRGMVDAWFGLDPVDNQFLMAPREFARTDLADIGIPTAFLGAEVESNCAPAADSYPTLYPLAPSPSVLLVGVGAGHTQFELESGCTGCGACSPAGTADSAVVFGYSLRYFTAFFARELLGDASVGPLFEGAGAPVDTAASRDHHRVALMEISNADRVVFPEVAKTKGDVVAYYERIAPRALPHLLDRPLSIRRYPKGLAAPGFFQKNVPPHYPDSIRRLEVARSKEAAKKHPRKKGPEAEVTLYPVVSEEEHLPYLANQGAIELHIPIARIADQFRPDRLVIDLDPPPGPVTKVRRAAHLAREMLAELGLPTTPVATGSKGYHVVAALTPTADGDTLAEALQKLAALLAAKHPDEMTTAFRVAQRGDRVFVDWLRNRTGQTVIAPYSLRARPRASIATPITWSEIDTVDPDAFTITDADRLLDRPDSLVDLATKPTDPAPFVAAVDAAFEKSGLTIEAFDRFRS